jgi:hypothetical protein
MDVIELHAKTFQGVVNHPTYGPINTVQTLLFDQHDRRVDSERLKQLHKEGRVTGYCVKIRIEYINDPDKPSLTIVNAVKPGEVMVGNLWMSLEDFHKYYELD